jgi:hypothetical protein
MDIVKPRVQRKERTMQKAILLIAATCLVWVGGCTHHEMTLIEPDIFICCAPAPRPENTRAVDLLFVVDNSGSMADEQDRLRRQFPLLMQELRTMRGGLPDLHIGVTSTDLGAGPLGSSVCNLNGDAGMLLTGACTNPTDAPYIIDVEPLSCEIIHDGESSTCLSNTCGQNNCTHEYATTFMVDAQTGCPRCRNYANESLEEVFSCIADLGTTSSATTSRTTTRTAWWTWRTRTAIRRAGDGDKGA